MNRLLLPVLVLIPLSVNSFGQETEFTTRFETPRGVLEIYPDTLANIEGVMTEPILSLAPKEGVALARARITEGTEVTEYRGKSIEYNTATDALTIVGAARIIRDENIFEGHERITFDPEAKEMRIIGTKDNLSRIRYREGGMSIDSREPIFIITFIENADGKLRMQSAQSLEKL